MVALWNPFRRNQEPVASEQPVDIDEEQEKEHSNDKSIPEAQEEMAFEKEVEKGLQARADRARELMEKKRKRAAVAAMAFIGISALATNAESADFGAYFGRELGKLPGQVVGELGKTAREQQKLEAARERERTRRIQEELRKDIQREREQTARLREEYRLEREKHKDTRDIRREEIRKERDLGREMQRTEQVRTREGSDVQETEIEESERTRREGLKRGVNELGSDTRATGTSPYSRKRNSDAISTKQMEGGVPTSPLPGETGEYEGSPATSEVTEERRNELATMATKDHEKASPREEFRSMSENEREVYGRSWNAAERGAGDRATGIILKRR